MKKLLLGLGLAGALMVPTLEAALDTGVIDMTGSGHEFGGGPFTVDVTSGLDSVVGGNGALGAAGTGFSTFCIEYNEYITLPNTYNAELNTAAVNGGGGPNPDPVSKATAWLYSQYRAGTLAASAAGYVNNTTGNNQLQQAIWWLEQETDAYVPGAPLGSETAVLGSFNNYLVTAAVAATGAGTAANARTIDANGAYGVYALNLYDGSVPPGLHQDMLAIAVPEPATVLAGALLLLPFGASTIRVLRRNRLA